MPRNTVRPPAVTVGGEMVTALQSRAAAPKHHSPRRAAPEMWVFPASSRRSQLLKVSTAKTTPYRSNRMVPTRLHSRQAIFSFNKIPRPPAPT